jgi:ribA/ribD-fused uncharacterized protein
MSARNDTREALAAKIKEELIEEYLLAATGRGFALSARARLHAAIDELAALTEQPAAPQPSHSGDSVERSGSPSGAVSGGSGISASGTVVPGFIKPDNDRQVFFYEQDFYVLSNFSAFSLHWRGVRFETSEAAYHWEKFDGWAPVVATQIRHAASAHDAFKLAEQSKALRRPDWDDVKVGIMRDILRAKAEQHEYVRRKLLATGNRELIEDSWRDDFWGWGPNRDGQNVLGKLWMEVRAELRDTMHREAAAPSPAPAVQPPLVKVLADWEDKWGTLAGVMPEEWAALMPAVTEAAAIQSPRQLRASLSAPAVQPCAKIFDHKWLDPNCVESGCQSLVAAEAVAELVEALREFLNAEGAPMPPVSAGHTALAARGSRLANARNLARLLIAKHGQPQGGK